MPAIQVCREAAIPPNGEMWRPGWLRPGRLNDKTSLRTAYGIFHDTARFFHYPKTLVFTPPYSISRTTNDVQFSDPYRNAPNPYPYRRRLPRRNMPTYQYQLPVRVTSYPDDFSGGFSQQWNVNLQRDLGADLVVSAAYVGTKAQDLPTSRQINPAVYGPGATLANRQQRRLYPQFENIMSFDPIGRSEYHGMQLSVNKRFSRGYSILANYTLSKARDNASNDDEFFTAGSARSDGHLGIGQQRSAASPGDVGLVGTAVATGRSGQKPCSAAGSSTAS